MLFQSALVAAGLLGSLADALPTEARAAGTGRLTVYWGAEDDSTTLDDVCGDSSYGIVNLAFLNYFFSDGGYPSIAIGDLDGPSDAQRKAGATGLKDGSSLVPAIKKCQAAGKLVILSMGGANDYADVTLKDDAQGQQIADTVWNLFLGGTKNSELRPFGAVKLDGVDLDNESGNPTGYLAMVKRLRSNIASDSSKKYYLTAAPQCPYPDASQPLDVCQQLDYVWVQFYNNGECNIAKSGFKQAVKNWSKGIGNAKLFIGALASGADGDEGYVDAATLTKSIQDVKNMNLPNYGGAMLWEAQLAVKNGNYQKKIAAAV
ncbi:endochitinase CHI3 [Purpureocillium lilacinum]|nr:endochitinase CHI3 [Purpureocillium lilacinum]OAQ71487.1 endochitinase CHI3 [Purpureocillium lilacinum]OAQ76675.1 endochitinase CHI3 [Purpureocillium lilacinum]GJN75786.1 endochitinase 3 [Purpureocillium lilacinum]GJN79966.1 endochitinase 3 [Purpureocillium lilacinum]